MSTPPQGYQASSVEISGEVVGSTANTVLFANGSKLLSSSANLGWDGTTLAVTGAITGTTFNGMTLTASTGTFTLTNLKTLDVRNSLIFSGTDGSTAAFGAGGTVAYVANKLSVFAATTSAELAGVISDETGVGGVLMFNASPTLTGVETFSSGAAITAGSYQSGRDADATNQLHFNVPTGAGMEWSINDAAKVVMDSSGNVTVGGTLQAGPFDVYGNTTGSVYNSVTNVGTNAASRAVFYAQGQTTNVIMATYSNARVLASGVGPNDAVISMGGGATANLVLATIDANKRIDFVTNNTLRASFLANSAVFQGNGGLTVAGGSGSGNNLILESTEHTAKGSVSVYGPSGSLANVQFATTLLSSVSGATVTATSLIPDGAFVLGVSTRITTGLGVSNGTTGYAVGDGTDPNRWGDIVGTASGTTSNNTNATASFVGAFTAANDVVLTAAGGNFDGTGAIRVVVAYIDMTAPTI